MLAFISITLTLLLSTRYVLSKREEDSHTDRFRITHAASLSVGFGDQCESVLNGYRCDLTSSRNWGPYTPWFNVKSTISPVVADKCEITFVQLLSRHGARYPTSGASTALKMVVSRMKRTAKSFPGKYAFLKDYKFKCVTGALTTYGQREMFDSGVDFYRRYQPLTNNNDPFCRASGMKRVVMSGKNFTYGFLKARGKANSASIPVMVLPHKLHKNCTLAPSTCTAFEMGPKRGLVEALAFAKVFTPSITKRLNNDLGTSLSNRDTLAVMSMCPFDTVAHPLAVQSPFCALFTTTEFDSYNTFQSFLKYYDYGAGDALGPSIGVGWTNELLARLTNTPVRDQTSTNSTLDQNPATFPLGRKLYADFSHDTIMTSIMFAMGLYPKAKPGKGPGVYNAATAVPFAARVYIEKMRCPHAKEELVRILVNGRVVPLPNCGADTEGRCTLSRFVASQSFASRGGDWKKCYDGIYGTMHHIGLEQQGGEREDDPESQHELGPLDFDW